MPEIRINNQLVWSNNDSRAGVITRFIDSYENLRSIPSKLSYLAGKSTKDLERVIYYEMFMVVEPGNSGLEKFALIEEDEYLE